MYLLLLLELNQTSLLNWKLIIYLIWLTKKIGDLTDLGSLISIFLQFFFNFK